MAKKVKKISVLMITYNHQKYIETAIQSVMDQKTDYQIELVIGEDCSTDNTRKICNKFAHKYPDTVKILPSVHNLGVRENFLRTLKACDGEYIAYLEGDDYWVDDSKLQIQVDYLEKNKGVVICCHDANILSEQDGTITNRKLNPPKDGTIHNVCSTNYIYANSVVFRNLKDELIGYELDSSVADWVLWVYLCQFGIVHYIDKVMSVYREHDNGVFSKKSRIDKLNMTMVAADNWKRLIGSKCNDEYGLIIGACASEILKEELNSKTIINKDVIANCLIRMAESSKYNDYIFNELINIYNRSEEENSKPHHRHATLVSKAASKFRVLYNRTKEKI